MNGRMILYLLGRVMLICSGLMLFPLFVVFLYREPTALAFLIPILLLAGGGLALSFKKPRNRHIYTREGFLIVALSWIVVSLFGALPFWISREIPSFLDALFETVSGFTTTGSSILFEVEQLSHGMLFWRSFTHWVGGMGVLVFLMALLPNSDNDSQSMYILRAESPGPQVGKLVSKMKLTAQILYGIYFGLTLIEFILLALGGMPIFDSVLNAFSTAGTGGFGIKSSSIAFYDSAYADVVISVFMVLFGINFNVFYLILIGAVGQAFRCQEARWYLGIIGVSTVLIAADIYHIYGSVGSSLRYAFFQVTSIITTTGFATADFNHWPLFSQVILVCLMFCGACAGSTGGGIKVSRLLILGKIAKKELKHMISPRSVNSIKFEGKTVDQEVFSGVGAYFIVYTIVFAFSFLVLALDPILDFTSSFTAVAACLNNVGPGLGIVGPAGNFGDLSILSKIALIFDMLAGRLELFPMLMLFSPLAWKR